MLSNKLGLHTTHNIIIIYELAHLHVSANIANRCEEQNGEERGELLGQSNGDGEHIIDESKLGPPFGIVINGHSLVSLSQ